MPRSATPIDHHAEPGTFDPAEFVSLWERLGNVVYFDESETGRSLIGVYLGSDAAFYPEARDLRHWRRIEDATPDWKERVVAYLKSRGQVAGRPLNGEA